MGGAPEGKERRVDAQRFGVCGLQQRHAAEGFNVHAGAVIVAG